MEGSHSITVFLTGTLYFEEGNYKKSHYSEHATVYFTVNNTPSSPSPSPSLTPTPTAALEAALIPYEVGVQNASLYLVSGGMVAFTVIISFLGLLVCLIKRK